MIVLLTRLCLVALCGLIVATIASTNAASNVVPRTGLSNQATVITPNSLKPPQCASITVTNKISGAGTITGTVGNDLIFGSAGTDTVNAGGGNDCVVGGGGIDILNGEASGDVLIGGPGVDLLDGGGGGDICYGGPDSLAEVDTFTNCATQFQ